ncbi:Transcriptional regulator, LacI family [uncultured Pleomorphomonas sp.]|uniref:Transcriptional regulator, LacI family n=1 Tax=uncultured Pleomorphomonas sp. TaxID=442121 RepID=A0A212LN19_9HYPH|nr:LacI family DNA-binding transcriptional regulator [uncultured Pleomorphomonas sp.]SCM78917.1 Transcriptional regulator, LacI family [uncultured Pleomorphomonas sp.]
MASLKDVSKAAGVSPSTVSRVITGSRPVDEETRERVLEAIRTLDYRPNLLARGLRNKSRKSIGLMVPSILHETFANFIYFVEEACVSHGFTMLLGNTQADAEAEERVLKNFIGMSVDGVIVSQVSDESAVVKSLNRLGIPVVGIDRAPDDEEADRVVVFNREAGEIAARYLYSMGHRQVACIGGPETVSLSRERLDGFRSFLTEKGIEVHHVSGPDFEFETGIAMVRKLLGQGCEFSAIWAHSDLLAIGAMQELARLGMRIPEDVSIMGMDGIQLGEMVRPTLTTIRQPFREICQHAVRLLLERIEHGHARPTRIVVRPELIVRDSVCHR